MRRWQTFSLFALSELVCTKNAFYPILLFPLLSHPKLLPFWSVTDGQRKFFTPCSLSSFFPHWARGALPAGATLLGWPNYGVEGRLNKWLWDNLCTRKELIHCWPIVCFVLLDAYLWETHNLSTGNIFGATIWGKIWGLNLHGDEIWNNCFRGT
jgi:hypothetical protein